jgi:dTDP-4-amino-4,6-dideoxygalactose transaminase
MKIPFNRPTRVGTELDRVQRAVEGNHLSGDGPFTRECSALLEGELGVARAMLTTSCTHALEMAALLLDVGPGDEVILPSFTFVSTVNAFVLRGARPVFADVRPDTLNLDAEGLEPLITPRTRAIVVVHYAGIGCDMRGIMELAGRHGIPVVEDAAHALFGKRHGTYLGRFGTFATLSFHETKNFTCGEGGALLINDERYTARAEIIREKGTNRSRFFRGQVDKYSWVDVGSSYLPSDMLAGYLAAQLAARDQVQGARRRIWDTYHAELGGWAAGAGVRLPAVPGDAEPAYHLFFMVLPSGEARDGLIAYLRERGIASVFHYLPLHLSEMGRRLGGREGDCPVTEAVSDRLVRLPFFTGMTEGEQARVVEAVRAFRWTAAASVPAAAASLA